MHITPLFSIAMRKYKEAVTQHGADSPQAKRTFMLAFECAPQEFKDEAHVVAEEMGLMPKPCGYTADGQPAYRLEDIAQRLDISPDDAHHALNAMLDDRQVMGLDTVLLRPEQVFPIQ